MKIVRTIRIFNSILFSLILYSAFFTGHCYANNKIFNVTSTCEGIILDGVLSETCWSEANWISDFMQMEPDRLSEPSEKTIVKILYNNEALFFGFRCYDSHPNNIKTSLRRRDEEPPSDWDLRSSAE